jgi:antitoxin MazE
MQLDIIPIGNSMGIRIPQAFLKECGFDGQVEAVISNKQLILKKIKKSPKHKVRQGWAEAAKRMAAAGDDALVMSAFGNTFDEEEWEW